MFYPIKASEAEIAEPLHGNWREEHLFAFQQALALYDAYRGQIQACDAKLEHILSRLSQYDDTPAQRASAEVRPKMRLGLMSVRRYTNLPAWISPRSMVSMSPRR